MFHTYTVFITQSIVPHPLHYDKYLALSCKSHTLSQFIINVLYRLYVVLARCPCVARNIKMIKGRPYMQMWRGVWVSFFKIAIVSFLSVRYKSDNLYCRMAGTPSSTTLFFIRVEIKYIICSITCS